MTFKAYGSACCFHAVNYEGGFIDYRASNMIAPFARTTWITDYPLDLPSTYRMPIRLTPRL
jgi:hypothetical protein